MKYIISDSSVTKINETVGTIQIMTEGAKVEISDSLDFTDVFVLSTSNPRYFSKQLYIRAYGTCEQPIEINVIKFYLGEGSGAGSSSGDSDTVDDMLDSIFGGGSDTVPDDAVTSDEDANDYLDSIFGGNSDDVSTEDVANNNDVDDYLDSIFGGL